MQRTASTGSAPTSTQAVTRQACPKSRTGGVLQEVRLDSRIKVTGAAGFGLDVRLPELRYAAVARPPVFGASLKSFDDSAAKAMPGVVKVKAVPSGVAVIADSTWRARQARNALQIVWD